ncbi:MAG: response regulator, partial [candidate division WOR-3 bacterium]
MSSTLRPRVVIVDDEADFRTTLTDILSTRGYDCISAATIQEGTRLISELQPDLCLLDLRLPDGSGLDLLTRMAELSPATETVVLTGFASLPTAVKALNLGAFGYLEKPYNADRLFLTLERALEHRRLVQAIRRSEAAYEQLLTATGAIVFSLDPRTWRVADTNPAFARMLGLDPSDLRLDQLVPESELATVKQALTELSRARPGQSASLTLDVPLLGQDGAAHWFSVNAFCVPRSSAEPRSAAGERVRSEEVNLLLVGSDASASRRAVSQLERTKEFIEGVFAALPCGVVIVDSDYRIIDCNPTYTQPLGLTRAAVKGKYCYQVFSNHQSPCAMFGELCPITAARTTGAIGRVYREHRLPDGRQRNLECSASPLHDEHDSIIGFVVVINDLTDLREAEERLQEAKIRLESLNRDLRRSHEELQEKSASLERANRELIRLSNAKSDFVATVSHELRTPLTAISEGIALVEDGSLGVITQNQRRFLALARQNTRRLSDLINDLLDLSKIEAGRLDLHPRRLDLAAIVREVVGAFAPLARDKNLSLSCSFGKPGQDATTSPFEVLADEASVHRIFNNLI